MNVILQLIKMELHVCSSFIAKVIYNVFYILIYIAVILFKIAINYNI